MRRRPLLKAMAAAPLASLLPRRVLAEDAAAQRTLRRVRRSDPAWPSPASWDALRREVGGNLIEVEPLLAPCTSRLPGRDCLATLESLRNPFFLGDQPAGTQVSGWLDAWTPEPSVYAVRARDAADVAAAVRFARAHRLRLVVKGGGHSYQGTSNAPDSLLVWTRSMNRIQLHDAFVAQGCAGQEPVPAATIEAGAMWIDAYDAVTTRAGRYVQGGGCTTVGVAGLVQSGGFGSLSKRFGTAAGGLLEAEVVTADGVVRTVNACRDPDLFWAIKGGGGGSFGVVTRVTLRTHALPDRIGFVGGTIQAKSKEAMRELIARFLAFYADALLNPHWGEIVKIGPDDTLRLSMVCQGLDRQEIEAVWRPFADWVRASPQYATADLLAVSEPARHWWDVETRERVGSEGMTRDPRPGAPAHHAYWSGDGEQASAFLFAYDSLWLPAALLAPAERGRLADALFAASRHWQIELHFNKGLAGAPAEAVAAARDTATNPAVLDAFALAIIASGGPPLEWLPFYSSWARGRARDVGAAAAELRKIVPDAGSYVSESSYFNASWQTAFWGANYPRLRDVKSRYDPDGLFFVHHGVGSEEWSGDGFERTRDHLP